MISRKPSISFPTTLFAKYTTTVTPNKDNIYYSVVPVITVCKKLEKTNINLYIINWIANFLRDRRQKVIANGIETNYVDVSWSPWTVFMFLIINDLTVKDPDNNLLVKFADDMTVSAPVKENYDSASAEVDNIEEWTQANRMSINLTKMWEIIATVNQKILHQKQ